MARKVVVAKVGQLISLTDYAISKEQVQGIYTVFNYELSLNLLAGNLDVESVRLGEGYGSLQEVVPNIRLDAENRLQYYSLIPRKSDAVVVIIEYTETKEVLHVGSKIIALDENRRLICEAIYTERVSEHFDFQARYMESAGIDGQGNKVYGNRGFKQKDRGQVWDFL